MRVKSQTRLRFPSSRHCGSLRRARSRCSTVARDGNLHCRDNRQEPDAFDSNRQLSRTRRGRPGDHGSTPGLMFPRGASVPRLLFDVCGSRDTASERRQCYCFCGGLAGDFEKDNRGGDALFGADFFGSDGPRTHRRRRVGGIIRRRCARTSGCRGRSHCRLYRGTINCERLGLKTIKLSPAAGGARFKCKLQITYAGKGGLCGNASNSSAAICSNKRIRSTTRPTAGLRRGGVPRRRSPIRCRTLTHPDTPAAV
jgi:hypothetical protein